MKEWSVSSSSPAVSISYSDTKTLSFEKHSGQRPEVSGKSPAESENGQAEEGAEGGVKRLDLGGDLGFS